MVPFYLAVFLGSFSVKVKVFSSLFRDGKKKRSTAKIDQKVKISGVATREEEMTSKKGSKKRPKKEWKIRKKRQ